MSTTPSAKTKSPRGSSGLDDNKAMVSDEQIVNSETYQGTTGELETVDCESPDTSTPAPRVSESEPEAVVAADDCVDREPFVPTSPIMSETDRKLATRMTRAIADHLGLSGRTRSVRV